MVLGGGLFLESDNLALLTVRVALGTEASHELLERGRLPPWRNAGERPPGMNEFPDTESDALQ